MTRACKRPLSHLTALCLVLLSAQATSDWNSARLSKPFLVDGALNIYPVFSLFVQPGQRFELYYQDVATRGTVQFNGATTPIGYASMQAPALPGIYPLKMTGGGETAHVNVFVLTPADTIDPDGSLNGYQIGHYPSELMHDLTIYEPPAGFVEVTQANSGTPVSPNFVLGQFVSKQKAGYPKYLTLRPELLLKLEAVLAALNEHNHRVESLEVMSGYRTPWYNRSIGNVAGSRHVWGGAADIFVDQTPKDGVMDDLNADGRVDRKDAVWLGAFIDRLEAQGRFGPHIGGLGVYGANAAHGPFVHIDARGFKARW